ncbi:unnamed protein product [Rhizoctonia solani]|uniref:Myotubularin phosphatase domain-containing protein n=1 Tax=Rhizoctonia solani TaxID=456999 RepID=A0A8H3HKX0_9AGAM|nr:unnamed protein product [Rhizoctonia solani]
MFCVAGHDVQRPTHPRLHVRDARDAQIMFEACRLGMLTPVSRRLNDSERAMFIKSGSVFVWQEADDDIGLKRWTDGLMWSCSRMREPFLFYEEKTLGDQLDPNNRSRTSTKHAKELPSTGLLVKQTYSAIVTLPGSPPDARKRKWHITCYFTHEDFPHLPTLDMDPVETSGGYMATPINLIIDARPTTNAMANAAKGAGTENMDNYKEARKVYLGIDNIHVMRDSLARVAEALYEADMLASMSGSNSVPSDALGPEVPRLGFLDRQTLRRSGWIKHLTSILDGTLMIVKTIHVSASHALLHCSDGWDRTAQLSSLAQICLDPYFRTLRGFYVLVEKEWLSFGHKFLDRCGHLSSEKLFVTAPSEGGSGSDAAQAFFASVQNKFSGQSHLKETSPVFHQFLESLWQILRQFPTRFEYNEDFLLKVHYHLNSCQFGTFLFNCERERRVAEGNQPTGEQQTHSAWDWFEANRSQWLNPDYDPSSNIPTRDTSVLIPDAKDVRFWYRLYGRGDEEMNGGGLANQATTAGVELRGSVVGLEDDPVLAGSG